MKKRNKSLNFFKGLGCLGVVLIHVKFPNIFGEIVSLLSQFAVPIFIMTSGYFIYNSDLKTIKRRLLKMINIFLISFIIYTAFYIIVHFKTGDLSYWLISILSLKSLIKLIFFCTIDYAIHLWYLIAMIETYLLWYFIVKKNENNNLNIKHIYIYIYISVAIHIIWVTICESLNLDWFLKINFLIRAVPWFLIGYVIHQKYDNNKLKNVSIVYLIMFTLVGAVLSITPIILKTKINFSCIGIIIYSISIFLIAIKYSDKSFNKIIEYIGDKLSLNIYIFHIIIANILSYLVKAIFNFAIENTYYFPIIVLASSLLFSFTIDCIKNIIKHNNLNTIK